MLHELFHGRFPACKNILLEPGADEFRFEDCVPFTGDSLDHPMAWKKHKDLGGFPGEVLRLHFWMEKAELCSFRFDPGT